jgi:hypothetical protein
MDRSLKLPVIRGRVAQMKSRRSYWKYPRRSFQELYDDTATVPRTGAGKPGATEQRGTPHDRLREPHHVREKQKDENKHDNLSGAKRRSGACEEAARPG